MTLAAFQIQNHSVMQWSITHSQNCNSPSASSGLVRSMTPGPSFPSSLGFPVNWGPKFSNLVLSWKRTEVVLMPKYFISHCELVHGCIHWYMPYFPNTNKKQMHLIRNFTQGLFFFFTDFECLHLWKSVFKCETYTEALKLFWSALP